MRLDATFVNSTVVTKRNLPSMLDIYRFLRKLGVDQVVFNVMQANGRAETNFEHIFPTYTEIAATFRAFLADVGEARPMAFLVDIPLCTTEGIADFNRGYVERYVHYDTEGYATVARNEERDRGERDDKKRGLVMVSREDLDEARRLKRPACATCKYDAVCEGVWSVYAENVGWDEIVPVTAADAPSAAVSDRRSARSTT